MKGTLRPVGLVWCAIVSMGACGRSELFPARAGGGARPPAPDAGAADQAPPRSDGPVADRDAPTDVPAPAPDGGTDAAVTADIDIQLDASVDLPEVVQLTWRASSSPPSSFLVQRDGFTIAVLPPTARAFVDSTSGAGDIASPVRLTATTGTRTSGVLLDWAPAEAHAGPSHRYQVFALAGDQRVGASNVAVGQRAAPTTLRYEITRDDGAHWFDVGTGVEFEDQDAPLASLQAGAVEALPRYPRDYVRLRVLDEPKVAPVSVTYRVRAVTSDGAGRPSPPAVGFRGAGTEVTYAWQRSAADSDGDYTDLPDVTGAIWYDGSAPVGGARYYRARLSADGAAGTTLAARAETVAFRRLSGGAFRTCGLRTDDRLVCWGDPFGSVATPPDGTFKDVSAGVFAGCAIRTDDRLVCWGKPDGSETPGPTPTTDGYLAVGLGIDLGCGLRLDGTLACWGQRTIAPLDGTFKALSVGGSHVCAIRTDDRVQCWGDNKVGAAPPGPSSDTFKVVRAGWGHHTCGIRSDDRLVCWGDNGQGQAPAGPSDEPFTALSAGAQHTCGLRGDGLLLCWGDNSYGQAPPAPSADTYVDVATGYRHTCALRSDGHVVCFGDDSYVQLPVVPPAGTFRAASLGDTLTSGGSFGCGVRTDGKLVCWGDNTFSQAPPGPFDGTYQSVSTDYYSMCALNTASQAVCWGSAYVNRGPKVAATDPLVSVATGDPWACGVRAADAGISCWIGDANFGTPSPLPDPPAGRFQGLDIGVGHACAVREDGKVLCWGESFYGQAPPGPSADSFTSVSAGQYHTCGLRVDGTVDCWGGLVSASGGAVPPLPADRFRSISAGYESVCGVRDPDRRVVCWVSYADTALDVGVPSLDPFKSVAAGRDSFCAVRDDDRLLCWGGPRGL